MVDEHAGELVADRLVQQHGGDGGVDTAGEAAQDARLAHLLPDLLDRLVLEGAHGPVGLGAGDVAHEVLQDRRALRRVHHLEMELRGVELARLVGDHGDGRVGGAGDGAEALGELRHSVAVAHPYRVLPALLPHAVEQGRALGDLDLGAAELAVVPALHLAAELVRHGLLAVADAEHRHAGLEDGLGCQRRVLVEHRGGSAGEDHALGLHRGERRFGALVGHDLRVHALLAHAPRDELGDLGAEVDDQNLVVGGRHDEELRDRGARGKRQAVIPGRGVASSPE
jgi:hypothetical protein